MVSWNPTGSFVTGSLPPDRINGIFWEETPDLPISPLGNPIVPTEVECCLSEEYEITKTHQLEMAPFNKKVIIINLKLLNKEVIEKINTLIDTSTKLVDLILKLQIPNVFTESISPLLHNRNIKNSLTTLEITSESALSNLELENLAQFLHSNRSLKTLQLEEINTRHCEKKVANKLIDALANNTTLEYLKLHTNGYGGEEESRSLASVVARALIRNMTLRSLSISGHQVDDECAKIIAQSLEKKYPSLISLELVEAKLSFIGGKYICSAAKNNTTLKVLRLDHNDICKSDTNDNTVKSGIADLVKSNSSLIELSAMGNGISIEENLDILEGLKCNNSLESLNIHENDYDEGAGEEYIFSAENSARYLQIAQEISNSNNTIIQTHGISDGCADDGISGDSVLRKLEERNYQNKQLRNATLIALLLPQFYSKTSSLRLREKRSIEG